MASFIRGALVSYMPTFGTPVPNVIVFQFNPETISHEWSQATTESGYDAGSASSSQRFGGDPQAASGMPPESFSFTLSLNADSDLPGAPPDPNAAESGIYTRLAALEMLLFPIGSGGPGGLLGSVSASASTSSSGASLGSPVAAGGSSSASATIPASQVPTVLFVWGPSRVVPVRVTSLSITEKLYDVNLNPTYAEAEIRLSVLTPQDLGDLRNDPLADLARTAYVYTQGERQTLAIKNYANGAQSIIGMIP